MKVLFVCAGNTCRSPIAEAVFNSLNTDEDNTSKSAGISVVPGSYVTNASADVIRRELKVDLKNNKSKLVEEEMLKEADIVLTVSKYVREYLKTYYKKYNAKIYTLSEYVGLKGEIKDPYGGTVAVYQNTYNQIRESVSLLLSKIKKD